MGFGQYREFAQNYIAQVDAQQARDVARDSEMTSDKTKRNLERLYMVTQAMWELMAPKLGLTEEELIAKIKEVDLRDGRLDGQNASQTLASECRHCGRMILSGQTKCSWCGAENDLGPFVHTR